MRAKAWVGGLGAAALLTVGGAALASPAYADSVGGCPTGDDWVGPVTTAIFIDQLDNGNAADHNGDGLACFRVNKGQTDKHGGVASFTWKDNTN